MPIDEELQYLKPQLLAQANKFVTDLPDGILIDEKTGRTAPCRVMASGHRGRHSSIARVRLELFPGRPCHRSSATGSHIVNRGTPVAPLLKGIIIMGEPQLNVQEKTSRPSGMGNGLGRHLKSQEMFA